VEIQNLRNHPVEFDADRRWGHWEFDFADNAVAIEEEFSPNGDWEEYVNTLENVYVRICQHAGISNIQSENIRSNLRVILGRIDELHRSYSDSDVEAFPFAEVFRNK
jgi:hypothetical protein